MLAEQIFWNRFLVSLKVEKYSQGRQYPSSLCLSIRTRGKCCGEFNVWNHSSAPAPPPPRHSSLCILYNRCRLDHRDAMNTLGCWPCSPCLILVMSNQRFFKIVCFRFPPNVPKKIEFIRFRNKIYYRTKMFSFRSPNFWTKSNWFVQFTNFFLRLQKVLFCF